jgi:phenylalanyl-tRNA synthetase beta chain
MKVTFNWLQDYVDLSGLSAEDLDRGLTMAGLEVEAVVPIGRELASLIVGEVLDVQKHPHSDHLTICRVSNGKETLEIVCGAPNVRPGIKVPLALPGTTLPSGLEIQKAVIRKIPSAGMICSEKELGLSDDHSGIMILPDGLRTGEPLSLALGLEDTLLEVNVTPNRADCLSHMGIAREIAAIFNRTLKQPDISAAPAGEAISQITSVAIVSPKQCPRYAGRIVRGVTIGPSPLWLRQRLNAVGIRSISNIVDVTNYVLMEYGQPLHAFDFDTLGDRRIVVRLAEPNERLTTLDGQERALTPDMLVIADGEKGAALAGVMGGLNTEIQPSTKTIFIESAYFEPRCIRRTSKRLSLSSEASIRFERGVDIEGVLAALDRAALLMQELGGGEIVPGRIDEYPLPPAIEPIRLNIGKTSRFLGLTVTAEKVSEMCRSLGLGAVILDQDWVEVSPTSFRRDLSRPVDLMEEVARLIGYDHIPVTIPDISSQTRREPKALPARRRIKEILTGLGFDEIITYSFISEKAAGPFLDPGPSAEEALVRISNPISEDQTVMRNSLIPGLLTTMSKNWAQRNLNLRHFEMGKVFKASPQADTLPEETHHLTVLWTGKRYPESHYFKAEMVDYYDLKGALEALIEALKIADFSIRTAEAPAYFAEDYYVQLFVGEEVLGQMGEIPPQLRTLFDLKEKAFLFDLNLDRLIPKIIDTPVFKAWPRFPETTRDMALIIDESVPWKDIQDEILSLEELLIQEIELFDLYVGKPIPQGKKNMGVRIHYRSPERTLLDEEVNIIQENLLQRILNKFGASLREK